LNVKKFFLPFLIDIYPFDPDPWIRIFLWIRIQEAKILRIQWILSTAILEIFSDASQIDYTPKY